MNYWISVTDRKFHLLSSPRIKARHRPIKKFRLWKMINNPRMMRYRKINKRTSRINSYRTKKEKKHKYGLKRKRKWFHLVLIRCLRFHFWSVFVCLLWLMVQTKSMSQPLWQHKSFYLMPQQIKSKMIKCTFQFWLDSSVFYLARFSLVKGYSTSLGRTSCKQQFQMDSLLILAYQSYCLWLHHSITLSQAHIFWCHASGCSSF